MNLEKLNKDCKEANEKWRKMMDENNPFDTISNIAKVIRDSEDKELALAFTNVVGSLLRENGVVVKTSRYEFETDNETDKNKYIIKKEYGVSFDGLDFTEHDKKFKDEIKQLESELSDVQKSADEYYNKCIDLTKQVAKLESELETKDNIQKINLNETIKVKLTPYGAEIYYKQFDELNKKYGREICNPQMPRIDKDGYTEFQLWHFIELYGQHIGMCNQNVIEPLDIVYCGNDKCHSYNVE